MNNSQGALHFQATLDYTQLRQGVDAIRRDIMGLNNNVQQQTKLMDSSFKNLAVGIGSYFSAQALGGFIMEVINVRGEFQKTEIAFGTMLGSQEKAQTLMGQMVDLAAKTPFSLQEVSSGAKQLLAFQIPAEQVVDTLTRMGNIAAGLGVPLDRINLVYGQVKAKGKLMGDDLRQFTEAGIPMVAELAKKFKISTSEITKMVTAGKIGFKDVQDVLFSMTNEGGMFFNLMEKQSKSLSGQVSNLSDSFDQMLNKIGESNQGFLSDAIESASYLVDNYETVAEVIGVAVTAYGAYRAALIATAAWQKLSAGAAVQQALAQGTLTTAQAYGASATVILQRAQASLNATLIANPIGIVIGLVAGLTYVIYKNISATTQWEDLQNKLNETTKKGIDNAEEQQSKINTLIGVIRNKNTTDAQAKKALDEINRVTGNRIEGLTVEGIRLGNNTKAISGYIEMLKKEAKAKALIESITQAELNNKKIDRDDPNNLTLGERFGNFDELSDVGKTAQERKAEVMLRDRIANNKMIREGNAELQKLASQGVNITEQSGRAEETAIKNNTEKVKKAKVEHKKEVEKIYGEDTIKGLQQRISKLNEVMETSSFGGEKYNNAKSQKTALEARLKDMTASFSDYVSETERQWNNYYKIADFYGKETANSMYRELFKGSESYLQYLEKEQQALQNKKSLTEQEKDNLILLTEKIQSLNGSKTPLENWKDSLSENLRGVKSFAEQLAIIEKMQGEVFAKEGNSNNFLAFNKDAEAQKDNIIKQQQDQFNQLLEEQRSYEEKSLAIQKEYDDMRALAKTDAEIKKVDDAYSKKFTDLFLQQLQDSDAWLRMFSEMESVAIAELTNFRMILIQKLKESKTEAEKIKIGEFIKKIDDEIRNRNPFQSLITSFKSLIDKIKEGTVTASDFIAVLKDLDSVKNQVNGLIDSFQGVSDALGLNIDTSGAREVFSNVIDGVSGIGQAVSGFLSGNPLDMVKGVMKAVSSIGKLFNKDNKKEKNIKRQAAQLKELETAYNDLAFAAERAFGSQKYSGQRDLIKNLEQQKAVLQGMLKTESSKKKADKEKMAGYQSQIQSINQSIAQIKEGIIKDVLQTDVVDAASKVGDALVDAFGRGEDSVKSLENAANDMIKNLLRNQLNLALQNKMKPILDNLLASSGFNQDGSGSFTGLTPEQIEAFKAQVVAAGQSMQGFLEGYSEIFGGIDENAQGLKGDIKGITEKTAGALEAQINAIRIYQVEGVQVMRNSLLQLTQIEFNTSHLLAIKNDIAELNQKTKQGLAGL